VAEGEGVTWQWSMSLCEAVVNVMSHHHRWQIVISKGWETPAGTQVRVGRVGVRVWNV